MNRGGSVGRRVRCEAALANDRITPEESERVYRDGWRRGFAGEAAEECPYREETAYGQEWLAGWKRGRKRAKYPDSKYEGR